MYTDKGFSHAIAEAVLEDNPHDASAMKILAQPENRIVLGDGTEIDLSEVSEEEARREGRRQQLSRMY